MQSMTENNSRKGLRKTAGEISKGTEDLMTRDVLYFLSNLLKYNSEIPNIIDLTFLRYKTDPDDKEQTLWNWKGAFAS